jgi:ubiquitin-protein ligase
MRAQPNLSDEVVIKLKLSGYGEDNNKVHCIRVSYRSTMMDLKRFIIRMTGGKFIPDRIVFRGYMSRHDHDTMAASRVQSGDLFAAYAKSSDNSIAVTLKMDHDWRSTTTYYFVANGSDSGSDLHWRIWRDYGVQPSLISLFTGLTASGDNVRSGIVIRYKERLSQYVSGSKEIEIETSGVISKEKYRNKQLSRLFAVKQLFRAFIERTEAYDLPHHIGLVLFGSEVECTCSITPYFDQFRSKVDDARYNGDTSIYDALILAKTKLEEYRLKYPNIRQRILCLSDGVDTDSSASALDAALALKANNIVCDSIMIGPMVSDCALKQISIATSGYAFYPKTLKEALHLNEMETVLSLKDREPRPERRIVSETDLMRLNTVPFNDISDARRASEPLMTKTVVSLDVAAEQLSQAMSNAVNESSGARDRLSIKRIMMEMRKLMSNPHPSIDVYPCADDAGFWRLIMQAPDSTPYAQGCYLLYIKFPVDFPSLAPEVRFVTPIHHCNINSQGRVCHSILDRNWTVETSVRQVLECVFGLLLSPDVSDPLDSHIALAYYDDCGAYEATIIEHTRKHASLSRKHWATVFNAESMSVEELVEAARAVITGVSGPLMTLYSADDPCSPLAQTQASEDIAKCTTALGYVSNATKKLPSDAQWPDWLHLLHVDIQVGLAAAHLLLKNYSKAQSCLSAALDELPDISSLSAALRISVVKAFALRAEANFLYGRVKASKEDLKMAISALKSTSTNDDETSDMRVKLNLLRDSISQHSKKVAAARKEMIRDAFRR